MEWALAFLFAVIGFPISCALGFVFIMIWFKMLDN